MASVEELVIKISAENSDLKKKLSESGKSVNDFGGMVSKLGPMVATAFSIGAVVSFGKASFAAFEDQEKANRKLLFSLQGNTKAFKELADQATYFQNEAGIPDETINQIQMLAAQSGKTTQQIKLMTTAAVNLSAATGQDLQASYMMLNGTLAGSAGRLGRLDKDFTTLTKSQLEQGDAITMVIEKYKGLAESSATASDKLSASWGELMENVGKGMSKILNPAFETINEQLKAATTNSRGFIDTMRALIDPMYAVTLNAQAFAIQNTTKEASKYVASAADIAAANKAEAATLIEANKKKIESYKALAKAHEEYMDKVHKSAKYAEDNAAYTDITSSDMGAQDVQGMSGKGITGAKGTVGKKKETGPAELAKQFKAAKLAAEGFNTVSEKTTAILSAMGGAAAGFGDLSAVAFGESSAAFKVLATGSVIISSIMAAQAAIAPPPLGYGPIVGPLAVAGIIASGLANVAKINGIGMEAGGIVPAGYPNDSYPAMLTSGERVTPPGRLPENGSVQVFGKLRSGDIYLSNKRGAYINKRKG